MSLEAADRPRDTAPVLRAVRPFLAAPLVGVLALPVGWPFWRGHLLAALAVVLVGSTLAAAGILLTLGPGSRTTGRLLIGAAALGQASWVSTRDTGALPIIGESLFALFYFTLLTAVLLRRRPRLQFRAERLWLVLAAFVLVVLQVVSAAILTPGDMGYSPAAHWPQLTVPRAVRDGYVQGLEWLFLALAATFVLVLRLQQRRLPELARRRDLWLAAGGGLYAVATVVAQYPIMKNSGVGMQTLVTVRGLQLGSAALIPLGLFASALVDTWEQLTTAARLQARTGVISPASVQGALRTVLHDPGLRLWLWVEANHCYVDADGHIHHPGTGTGPGRVCHHVSSPGGEPLAVLDLTERLLSRPSLVEAAAAAGGPALQVLQLQVHRLEQLREVQARLLETQERARRELARNLHDGVQQDLAALEIDVVRLKRLPPGPDLQRQIDECRRRVRDINEEVRRIARGLHPPALLERGLAGALEEEAERLGRTVDFELDPARLPPRVEIALYYVLSEALLNVHKHARARNVAVRLVRGRDALVATVADDGVGGTVLRLGGGLHGADDRIRSLRGALTIASAPGSGTELTVTLPLTEVAS